ncbi:MAG: autotransporter outer membrane beta-barrel domain-containing protein [Planctomycetota bacterium]|jgi:hypothetical protein
MTSQPTHVWRSAAIGLFCVTVVQGQTPLGTAFTYQGQLKQAGVPVNGTADFVFRVWNAETGGAIVGSEDPDSVEVVDGLFTVRLDFGAGAFRGDARWLEVEVEFPSGTGNWATLSPRQPLTAAPYALQTRGLFTDDALNVGIGTTSPSRRLHVEGDDIAGIIYGQNNAAGTEGTYGVHGVSAHGTGVHGENLSVGSFGALGRPYEGVYGESSHQYSGIGVHGQWTGSPPGWGFGGAFTTTSELGAAVLGINKANLSGGVGVIGLHENTVGDGHGVRGETASSTGRGVHGYASADSGANYGVYGQTDSAAGYAGYFTGGRNYFEGNVGIGTPDPLASEHIRGTDLTLSASALQNEGIIVEQRDAVVGLYSDDSGSWGSAISLSELGATGELVDKWTLVRLTSDSTPGSALRLTFGDNANYAVNTTIMHIAPSGDVGIGTTEPAEKLDVDGNVQVDGTVTVTNSDASGSAALLKNENSANGDATVHAVQSGTGRCGHFSIVNASSDADALWGFTAGSGAAVAGVAWGNALAIEGLSDGTGGAASFQTSLFSNTSPTLYAQQDGRGHCGEFQINNAGSDASALYAKTNGTGYAIRAEATSDVTPSDGGAVVVGSTSGVNIALDGDEIMARDNGETSTLYINSDGGDVVFGGAVDIGYMQTVRNANDTDEVDVQCPDGKRALGGGCECFNGQVEFSYSPAGNSWRCRCSRNEVQAHVICANLIWSFPRAGASGAHLEALDSGAGSRGAGGSDAISNIEALEARVARLEALLSGAEGQ